MFLAARRRERESAHELAVLALGTSHDGEQINKQIATWGDDQ